MLSILTKLPIAHTKLSIVLECPFLILFGFEKNVNQPLIIFEAFTVF